MKHRNPYLINDPKNIFEVCENSSHPELNDAQRLFKFRGYTFNSATELQRFFEQEGLDPRYYWIKPQIQRGIGGKNTIVIEITDRKTNMNMEALYAS